MAENKRITDLERPVAFTAQNTELVVQVNGGVAANKLTIEDINNQSVQQTVANFPGSLEVMTGDVRWYPPKAVTLRDVVMNFPANLLTGCTIDIKKNGTSIYADPNDRPKVDAGQMTSGVLPITGITLTTDDYLTVDIVTADGENLVVRIRYN